MAKRYSYRILWIWEQKNKEELEHDKKFEEKTKEKNKSILERIRKTEKDWKVWVDWLGWVEAF